MEVKTKFSIGQQVWFIHHNKIHSGGVYRIDICLLNGYQSENYFIHLGSGSIERDKQLVFESKEELIESI